ncbi:hypothetical protein [Okeania sp. SIO2B9]|uniref:hypothetical protein n=1 Tax=Okeania sp. SIO2B9 TaxID=2607782 RepID=UPI00142CA71F|nr:hypothetical protein [Okeania sp. SIO2B9]NES92203.1 hypothetical protein [Okeania sp. SIO2B9]
MELPEYELVDSFPVGATVVDADGGTVDAVNGTISWTVPAVTQATLGASAPSSFCYEFNVAIQN